MDIQEMVQSVEKGLQYLAKRQLPSGQFPVEITLHYLEDSPVSQDDALFASSLIAYSLGFIDHPLAHQMISSALDYFQSEMTGHGLWRYWNKSARRGDQRLYNFIPADLDDMANISYLMNLHGRPVPDNRKLMLLNRDRRGLFYTWLLIRPTLTINPLYWISVLREFRLQRIFLFWRVTEAGYKDVDGVVNANILLYLGEQTATQPVIQWLRNIVIERQEADCDKWYRDPFTFYYKLSRTVYHGVKSFNDLKSEIVFRLNSKAHEDGRIGENILQTALAANTLINLGIASEQLQLAMDYILRNQKPDGSWESCPMYYGGPQRSTSWGSAELTTGLCVEALHRYNQILSEV